MIFDAELIKNAYDILNDCKDLIDAKKDIELINNIIVNSGLFSNYYIAFVDKQMRLKYWEINAIDSLGSQIKWKTNKINTYTYIPESPLIESLKCDRFGILAHALYTSGEIVDLVDFFDKNYTDN